MTPGAVTTRWYVSPRFALSFALLSLWLLLLFCHFDYLPMVDLPQHASQLSLWMDWPNPLTGDAHFVPNFRTPYLLTYGVARLVAPMVGSVMAFKLLTWVAIIAGALALTALARSLGHSPWLGLLGFPSGLCHAFYFGFISFLMASALAVLCWRCAWQHGAQPSRRSALGLALLLAVTLAAHGIAFCIAAAGAAFLSLHQRERLALRLSPFALPVVLIAAWVLPGESTRSIGYSDFSVVWDQVLDLPASLVGMYRGDSVATLGGTLVLGAAVLNLGPLARSWARRLPLLLAVLGYWLFPPSFLGLGWLHARFVGFVIPALLLAFTPRRASAPSAWGLSARNPGCIAVLCGAWLTVFNLRLAQFNREARDFQQLVSELPPDLTIRPLVFDRQSAAFPTVPAFLHFPAYYQVQKGGYQGYSFAMYPVSPVRYRKPRTLPLIAPGAEWHPDWFEAKDETGLYDCFMVRSKVDRTRQLFGSVHDEIHVTAHAGAWWAYCEDPDAEG